MNNLKFVRPQKLTENIIFVDGLTGSGKTLVAPILSTLKHAELWKFNYLIEYLCAMDGLGGMSQDAAKTFVQLLTDLDVYNLMVAREINFRPTDASGVNMNLMEKRYSKRLKTKDGDSVVQQIQTENPFLIIMLHYQFIQSRLLFETFKERLNLYIVSVRHPLWLIENWYQGAWHRGLNRRYGGKWGERFGRDPREFTLCCEIDGNVVPWFAADWHEQYVQLKPLDQAIHVVYRMSEKIDQRYNNMSHEEQKKVIFVPFELFVTKPDFFTHQFIDILKSPKTSLTQKIMKKLQIPRPFISQGEIRSQRKKIQKWIVADNALSESQEMLDQMCSDYEQRYLNAQSQICS